MSDLSRPAAGANGLPPTTTRPLLCVREGALLDDLVRLAATAGVSADISPDPTTARSTWIDAPLILVGSDVASEYAAARLPHRNDLILIADERTTGPADVAVWALAAKLGADLVVFLPTAEAWLMARYATAVADQSIPPDELRPTGPVPDGRQSAGDKENPPT